MVSTLVSLLVLAAAALEAAHAKVIPSYVKVCPRNDPQYDQCVLRSVEAIRPHLIKGIPKMHIPPIEPLLIPALAITRDLEALKVKADLKNIAAYGGSNFVINKLKTDLTDLTLEMSATFPHIYVTTDTVVDGRLLTVTLKGNGLFKGNFTNVKVDAQGRGSLVEMKGKKFLQVSKLVTKVGLDDASLQFDNKDKNTAAITNTAINFVRQNKRQVFDIIRPIIDETAEAVAIEFANAIFKAVPFEEILPN